MAENFSFTIDAKDYTRLMSMMGKLSTIERDATVKKGLQEGVSVIIRQGKSNLKSSGVKLDNVYGGKRAGRPHIVKSFSKFIKKYSPMSGLRGYGGFKRPAGSVAHLIDRGTDERTTKSGARRGKVTANYYWTRAVEQKSDKAMSELVNSITKSINRIINRNNIT